MVVLRNIKKTANSISADYYPEEADGKGYMKLRLGDLEEIEHEPVGCMAPAHVRHVLELLSEKENVPETYTDIWY